MIYNKLYYRDLNGGVRYWTIEVEKNAYRTIAGILGREDTSEQVSDWTYTEGKNVGKKNGTTPEEQAIKVAESIRRIRMENGYWENIEDIDKSQYLHPMLAAKYYDLKPKAVEKMFKEGKVFLERKLDGCRCIVDKTGMWSRHGKEFVSCPHIRRALDKVFEKYPDLILDGELYFHSNEDNFNEVVSLIKKTRPTDEDLKLSEEKIQYWVYDIPSDAGTFSERYEHMKSLFGEFPELVPAENLFFFVLVGATEAKSPEDVEKYLEASISSNFEGAMVRLDTPYEFRRTKNLLKVKRFLDGEFPIVGFEEGRGNLAGTVGAILVDVNGVTVRAGMKFSREESKKVWENRDQYIGKSATIRYFQQTNDGSLRFPKCVDVAREDYE